MSKTKIWSLQFSCRRLAREARSLGRTIDQGGSSARDIEQHLATAAQLLQSSMDQLGEGMQKPAQKSVLDVAQLAFGDNAWANQSPMIDYKAPTEAAPSPEHRLGMRAAAQFFATPDLITFLCSMKKTGVLLIDTHDERFTVELDAGDIVHAHSDGAPEGERLGDVLVEHGVLAQADLEAMLAEGIRGRLGGRLGARLLEKQLATTEDLVAALETQIRRLFHRLFTAAAQEFAFWEGPCMWGESSMRLNATMLLLDGARAIDESHRDDAVEVDTSDADGVPTEVDIGAPGSWLLDEEHAAGPATGTASATTSAPAVMPATAAAAAIPPPAAEVSAAAAAPAPAAEPSSEPGPGMTEAVEVSLPASHPPHPLSPTPVDESKAPVAPVEAPSVSGPATAAPAQVEPVLPAPSADAADDAVGDRASS